MDGSAPQAFRVLLVEDDPLDAFLTKQYLAQAAVEAELYHVPDGEAALQFLNKKGKYKKASRPDLILLDMNLPKLDGKEVLQHIKMNPAVWDIPVIVVSGQEKNRPAPEEGMLENSFIHKWLDIKDFMALARAVSDFAMEPSRS